MHSPGATGKEEHDSQTFKGVHLPGPSVSAAILLLVIGLREWRKIRQSSTNLGGDSPPSHWVNMYMVFYCYAVYSYMISRNKGDVGQDNIPRDSI